MKPHVVSLILGHISTAPRPRKEADALAEAGYKVTVVGCTLDDKWKRIDEEVMADRPWKFIPVADIRKNGDQGKFMSFLRRGRRKLAVEQYMRFGRFSPHMLSYSYSEQKRLAYQLNGDLTIAHMESGLWIVDEMADKGHRIGVDFEDWFSQDLPETSRRFRPVAELELKEKALLRKASYCLTTSDSLANALGEWAESRPPLTIYNSFPDQVEYQRPSPPKGPIKFFWYSQTIGPERGLESLFEAIRTVDGPFELHLLGNKSEQTEKWISSYFDNKIPSYIQFHGLRTPKELAALMATYDVGFALDTNRIMSRDLTIPNKVFEYLQNGLALIVSDTKGQTEIYDACPSIGRRVPCDDVEALRDAIQFFVNHPEAVHQAKLDARHHAEQVSWARQKEKLLIHVESALQTDLRTGG